HQPRRSPRGNITPPARCPGTSTLRIIGPSRATIRYRRRSTITHFRARRWSSTRKISKTWGVSDKVWKQAGMKPQGKRAFGTGVISLYEHYRGGRSGDVSIVARG